MLAALNRHSLPVTAVTQRAPRASAGSLRAGSALLSGLFLIATACAPESKTAAGAQSVELQSDSEYAIARDLWLERGQARAALDHGLRAVSLNGDNAEAHHLVALLFLDFCRRDARQCQLDQAELHARKAVDSAANFREAQNTLGVVLIHQKKYAQAVAVLKPLSEDILYQTPENAWGNLGWAYLELGQLDSAIDALSRSVAIQPNFCVGHFRLGLARAKKEDYAGALKAHTDAVNVDNQRCQGLQEAYLGRAQAALHLSEPQTASVDLRHCVALDSSTAAGRECQAILNTLK